MNTPVPSGMFPVLSFMMFSFLDESLHVPLYKKLPDWRRASAMHVINRHSRKLLSGIQFDPLKAGFPLKNPAGMTG